jgi:hypothetical protein
MTAFSDAEIGRILKHRICARCYGDLAQMPAENRMWKAVCPTCGDAWGGRTISRGTAERRGQQGMVEAMEVKQNLVDLFPNPHKGRSREEPIEELGF